MYCVIFLFFAISSNTGIDKYMPNNGMKNHIYMAAWPFINTSKYEVKPSGAGLFIIKYNRDHITNGINVLFTLFLQNLFYTPPFDLLGYSPLAYRIHLQAKV